MKTFNFYVGVLGILSTASLLSMPLARADHHEEGVSAQTALEELKKGNKRFVEDDVKHINQGEDRRKKLATGQKPHTIVLSCSDSRVAPELLFDQGLGDLFVIRTAGNTVGSDAVASIEYAVEHLGSKLLVVMGHESCGAVKAALTTPVGHTAGSFDLDTLVGKIRPHVQGSRSLASSDKTLRVPVQDNVSAVTCNLMKRSKILREHFKKGNLTVQPAIYGLESGKVDFWDMKNCDGKKH